MSDIASLLRGLQPISRNIALASFGLSFASLALGAIDAYNLVYIPQAIFTLKQKPQVWRLATSMILSGPGLGIIADPYFLYTYGALCERLRFPSAREPGAYPFFLLFTSTMIIALNHFITGAVTFTNALTVALCYYNVAFASPVERAHLIFFEIPIKFLPASMVVLSGIFGGPHAFIVAATGIVSAHFYLFLNEIWPRYGNGDGQELVKPPTWWNNWWAGRRAERTVEIGVRRGSVAAVAGGDGVTVGGIPGSTGSRIAGGRSASFRGEGRRLGN